MKSKLSLEEIKIKHINSTLLKIDSNKKLKISRKYGYDTYGLSLLPAKLSGGYSLCQNDQYQHCIETCIFLAGNARFKPTNIARFERSKFFLKDRKTFVKVVEAELAKINILGSFLKQNMSVRLNVFSDLSWHKFIDMEKYENIMFYDYTKNHVKMQQFIDGKLPKNYHLTFSYSGYNWEHCELFLKSGGNVAIVFKVKGKKLPTEYKGFECINGDLHDLRFLDGKGKVIALNYKQPTAKAGAKINDKFIITL